MFGEALDQDVLQAELDKLLADDVMANEPAILDAPVGEISGGVIAQKPVAEEEEDAPARQMVAA